MPSSYNKAALSAKEFEKTDALDHAGKAATSPSYFAALVRYLCDKDKVVATRASWCLNWAARKNPAFLTPHVNAIIKMLQQPGVPDGIIRNCVNILQHAVIPESCQGELMNTCFNFVTTPSTPIAIKAFSLTILENLSKEYPEIQSELRLVIETQMENETAAFRSRGKKILKRLR